MSNHKAVRIVPESHLLKNDGSTPITCEWEKDVCRYPDTLLPCAYLFLDSVNFPMSVCAKTAKEGSVTLEVARKTLPERGENCLGPPSFEML